MNKSRLILRQLLRAVTAIAGVGFVAVSAVGIASWCNGKAGSHLRPALHFQIMARAGSLWIFSDDGNDAESSPTPDIVDKAPGIAVGRKFDIAALGFEVHYCELPTASRIIWSACLPLRAALVILLVVGVASHYAQKRCRTS